MCGLILSFSPSPQLIAIILSSLLFIKYIFLDKSETFPYSDTPPIHVNGKISAFSAPHQTAHHTAFSASSCPFALTVPSDSSLVSNGNSSLAVNHILPDTGNGALDLKTGLQLPSKSMEKLVHDGMVLKTGGGITRNKSNSQLQQLLSSAEVSIPPEPTPAVECVSVGTQTESVGMESPVFTIGGVERKDSLPATPVSQEPCPLPELPLVPRQVEQCLAILKSDVSTCCSRRVGHPLSLPVSPSRKRVPRH